VVELELPRVAGRAGLVLTARNSLVTTFVFYQALAWLGAEAGATMARLSRPGDPAAPAFPELGRVLSRIERRALPRVARLYYLEWMRAEWLVEQDLAAARDFVADPREALRRLAPRWKALEADAERVFWESRFRGAP
jgi:hypothetical protein